MHVRHSLVAALIVLGAWRACGGDSGAAGVFCPGEVWLDTDGKPIQAHSAGILRDGGVYYWYGEDKTLGNGNRRGVACYSSRDLVSWKNEGLALPKEAMPEEFRDRGICERPKVVKSAKTGKYVMWMHLDDQRYRTASAGVAVADRPTGPFVFLKCFRPIAPADNPAFTPAAGDRCEQAARGATYRDMNLFADDDGSAYVLYAAEDNATLYICRLSADCTDIERPAVEGRTWSRNFVWKSREAPAPFKHKGAYYLITSGCTGWNPNPCRAARAPHVLGPWEDRGEIFEGADAKTSFHSQSTCVIPAPGKPEGCFVYLGDRWFPNKLQDSRYVWWPLVVRPDGSVRVHPLDAWDWSAFDALSAAERVPAKPNLVFVLADDLGYGDVHCLNPGGGKIATPNLDRLAAQGMTFTDAHSGSSVCTPTRYGIMTGRYAWRTRLKSGVLGGFSPPLLEAGRLTVPALLRQHGYHTACVGKWHLGMTWPRKDGGSYDDTIQGDAKDKAAMDAGNWTAPIGNGPTACGFDSYFGISASLDMPPFVFIRDDRVLAVPTTEKKWIRRGPAAADFEAVDVLPALTAEAVAYIGARAAAAKAGTPFFLYLALSAPHTPVVPSEGWKGRSGLGDYADFVMQTDAAVGQVLAALEAQGLANDTLVLFTSDNGFAPAADPDGRLRAQGHVPSAEFRGLKSDIWEGGHRVPFFARWPGHVKAGVTCDRLICLTDLMATCAELLGAALPEDAGEDSVSFLGALLETAAPAPREAVVHHSISGRFAIRQGRWKLILCPGSGGWGTPTDPEAEKSSLPAVQLYDLETDRAETKNLSAEKPEEVARLRALLEKYIAEGRSKGVGRSALR